MAMNKRLTSAMRVISHDVTRNDRPVELFKKPESIGLAIVQEILKVYCLSNPLISYLQGMNNLLVPIVLGVFRNRTPIASRYLRLVRSLTIVTDGCLLEK
jgi:hypothetical protein